MAMTSGPVPAPRGREPFATTGVVRRADGAATYVDRPASLVELLRLSVERGPEAVALVELGGGSLTYEELWERALRVAAGLQARGVGTGERVAIALPNSLEWALAFWGVQLAGAVAVPLNVRLSREEIDWQVENSEARFVFARGEELPDGRPGSPAEPAPGDLAAIFFTSGTTGRPKGAMVTHANFAANSENAFRILGARREEGPELSTLVSVPLFHVTGCNSQMIPLLELGGRVEILPRALDVETFLAAVVGHRINHLISVPAIYHVLVNDERFAGADVGSVRWALYGGAPIAVPLVRRIQDAFPSARVGNGFGLTETSSLTSFLPHEDSALHPDSVGFPMPVVDLAIDSPEAGTGVGELLVRGPNVVAGYWRAPAATASAIVDGWLHTGDLARIDDEGLLYVVGRSKDMINRGGENVYAVEVENALAGAPGVGEAAVLGVADEMMGEKVGAVLVPARGEEVEVGAVIEYVRERLADFKVPQYAAVRIEPLPRNPGGKVVKQQLAEETTWGSALR
jgi:long-chain acyl-CoA synthetase